MPIYEFLVCPVTNYGFDTPLCSKNAMVKPLNAAMLNSSMRYARASISRRIL